MIYLIKIMGFSGQKENRTVRVKCSTTPDCAVIDFFWIFRKKVLYYYPFQQIMSIKVRPPCSRDQTLHLYTLRSAFR